MRLRQASCSCGQLGLTISAAPLRISICHCQACRRRTGSVYGVQARFDRAAVEIRGRSTAYARTADSGARLTFHFCPDCGSTVYYGSDADPQQLGVAVGAFADAEFPAPTVSVYDECRAPWVDLPSTIVRHE
jgi:hypothetical protein